MCAASDGTYSEVVLRFKKIELINTLKGSGFMVQGVGLVEERVGGSEYGIEEAREGLWAVQGAGYKVQGSGCRVQGAGCRVWAYAASDATDLEVVLRSRLYAPPLRGIAVPAWFRV